LGRNRFEGPGPKLLENERVVDLYLGGRGRFEAAKGEKNTGDE
jgi:hypothetical protein